MLRLLASPSNEQMLIALLRAYINRQILVSFHNLLTLIVKKTSFFPFLPMSQSTSLHNHSSTVDRPLFDPSQPSTPVSYPIKTLEELESRAYFHSFHYPFNQSSVPLPNSAVSLPNRPRLLVCHDMQGGYGDDSSRTWCKVLVLVAIGCKVLGTFLTEWEEGRRICDRLLESKESARMYAERLAELTVALGFDGWLINMEINLEVDQIPNLKEFVSHLAQTMHFLLPGSLVIWYDAVTIYGQLKWQDQLNEKNKPFFDICDGIFVNYTWKRDHPKLSAAVAGDRKFDVYMGIDVFGQNTYAGGQWNTNVALEVLKDDDVSAAIFAPGWIYETKQPPDFWTAQNRWWTLIEKSWGRVNNYPKMLPFYTDFDQGCGYHISVEGAQITEAPWNNMSCQGFWPFLQFIDGQTPETIQVLVDVREASYNGGGNVTFKGFLEDDALFTTRLFLGSLVLSDQPLHLTYSVKSDRGSLLGLCLQFSSNTNEMMSALIASSKMNQFSNKFSKVIMAQPVRKPEINPGWVIYEGSIAMNGHTLTEIHAVCCRLKPEHSDSRPKYDADAQDNSSISSPEEYFAVLGHIAIKDSEGNLCMPPSSSWLVEGQNIIFSLDSQGSRIVSLNIVWKLRDGNDFLFPKYNIYVEKLARQVEGNPVGQL